MRCIGTKQGPENPGVFLCVGQVICPPQVAMPKCNKRCCLPQKVTLPAHKNRLRFDYRPAPKTTSKSGGENLPAIAPAVFRFPDHLDLDGGGNSFWSDSPLPPYFMAGVEAGAPEPSDS